MAVGKSRRLIYVTTAVVAAVILILAVILLQQPIQPKTTPPPTTTAPTVSTAAASGVGQTVASLNGNLANLGSAKYSLVGFQYGKDAGLAGATNATVANRTATAAFEYALTGLTPSTAYSFRAWAMGDGFSTGSILTFTTLTPTVPPPGKRAPSVATSAASDVTAADATLNGDLANLGTASAVTVGFQYGTSPTLATATNVSLGAQSATGAFSDGITDLRSNTTYYVQAWGQGDGFAKGTIVSFTTAKAPSGNGHHVPPGWGHAACPTQAKGHGVLTRCDSSETYGQWKKEHPAGVILADVPLATTVFHGAAVQGSNLVSSTEVGPNLARAW